MSCLRARQQEIRKVRARDQEHEANGCLQHPDRETRRADDLFLHRLHLERVTVRCEHVILRASPLAPARHERCKLGLRLRRRDAVLHPPNQIQEMVSAVLAIRGIELQRQPHLDVVVHDVETGRHDADDFVLRTVHFDRLPNDVGSRRERRPPQLTGQHDEPRTVCAGLITSKPSSRLRRHGKRLEQLSVDDASADASRTIRGRHVGLARHVRADGRKRPIDLRQLEVFRWRDPELIESERRKAAAHEHELGGAWICRRPQNHRVQHREHRRVRTDADRERQDRQRGESGRAPQVSASRANVLSERIEPHDDVYDGRRSQQVAWSERKMAGLGMPA